MLRHRSGRVLQMGSVHVMISSITVVLVLVYSIQCATCVEMKQTLGSISAGACALCEDRSH